MKPHLSRIGKYQRARAEAGLCRYCDFEAVALGLCRAHQEYNRANARNHYRRQAGIPLGAPIQATGRPRVSIEAAVARLHEFCQLHPQVSPTTSLNGPKTGITRPV